VSRADIETFRRKIRELRKQYEHCLEELEVDLARDRGVSREETRGHGREVALEAHVRMYAIDPMLRSLGWEVSSPAVIKVEDPVEPISEGDNRRFLDYHGRDNSENRSLVILEAKRPSSTLPLTDDGRIFDLATAIREITKNHDPSEADLPHLWGKWLATLIDYVKRVNHKFGHSAERAVITNGEWFVIFDVDSTLLSDNPSSNNIWLFESLKDIEIRAEEFFPLVNYQVLSSQIPPQHPSALTDFVPNDGEAICAQVVYVSYIRHGERQPAISVRVAAWVKSPSGAWILFQKTYDEDFLLLSHDPAFLLKKSSELAYRANSLLSELSSGCRINLIPAEEFEKLSAEDLKRDSLTKRGSELIKEIGENLYQVVIGNSPLFLLENSDYEDCPYHFWGNCQKNGDAAGPFAIMAPTLNPRAFFPSGSAYHCAHKAIHNARKNICVILCFEEYLCCRCCALSSRCWPDENPLKRICIKQPTPSN
jgi:hypothetical protein